MEVKEKVQQEILGILSKIGTNGATITEIEKRINFERHTLSKYLSFMEGHGLIYHKKFGKAKVWFVNNAPIVNFSWSKNDLLRSYRIEVSKTKNFTPILKNFPTRLNRVAFDDLKQGFNNFNRFFLCESKFVNGGNNITFG